MASDRPNNGDAGCATELRRLRSPARAGVSTRPGVAADELVHGLSAIEVFESAVSEFDQRRPGGELIDDELGRRARHDNLAGFGDCAQASGAVDGPTEVVAVPLGRLT